MPSRAPSSAPKTLDMNANRLQGIADAVRRHAQRDGYVLARQVREHLTEAGLADKAWKDVVALIGPSLNYRSGRYYYVPAGPTRMRERLRLGQRSQQQVDRAVRRLIRQQRAAEAVMVERRASKRINFVTPAEVRLADGRVLQLLTREISTSGIRLIGTCGLRGEKVRVIVPRPEEELETACFVVQVPLEPPSPMASSRTAASSSTSKPRRESPRNDMNMRPYRRSCRKSLACYTELTFCEISSRSGGKA